MILFCAVSHKPLSHSFDLIQKFSFDYVLLTRIDPVYPAYLCGEYVHILLMNLN